MAGGGFDDASPGAPGRDSSYRLELERLLQCMERAPLSLERLEYRDDGKVLYRSKYNPSLRRDYQFCTPIEFLALLVPHVALRYERRIHSYGEEFLRGALTWAGHRA